MKTTISVIKADIGSIGGAYLSFASTDAMREGVRRKGRP
jgi:fructose 1,6-bisphosphatase